MLSPEAQALAEQWAARDRDLLAKLRRAGLVIRGAVPAGLKREGAALARDIEARAFPPRAINLAIKPKKKPRRSR